MVEGEHIDDEPELPLAAQSYASEHGFHEAVAWRDSGRWIPEGGSS
jgi:hypothetical protein